MTCIHRPCMFLKTLPGTGAGKRCKYHGHTSSFTHSPGRRHLRLFTVKSHLKAFITTCPSGSQKACQQKIIEEEHSFCRSTSGARVLARRRAYPVPASRPTALWIHPLQHVFCVLCQHNDYNERNKIEEAGELTSFALG